LKRNFLEPVAEEDDSKVPAVWNRALSGVE